MLNSLGTTPTVSIKVRNPVWGDFPETFGTGVTLGRPYPWTGFPVAPYYRSGMRWVVRSLRLHSDMSTCHTFCLRGTGVGRFSEFLHRDTRIAGRIESRIDSLYWSTVELIGVYDWWGIRQLILLSLGSLSITHSSTYFPTLNSCLVCIVTTIWVLHRVFIFFSPLRLPYPYLSLPLSTRGSVHPLGTSQSRPPRTSNCILFFSITDGYLNTCRLPL